MYVKLVPYPLLPVPGEGAMHEYESRRRKNRLIECEDLSYEVRHPLDIDTLLKIFEEIPGAWTPSWALPLGGHPETNPDQQQFPDEGLQLVILEITRRVGPEADDFYIETCLAYDCDVFIMSNEGRTIDRI